MKTVYHEDNTRTRNEGTDRPSTVAARAKRQIQMETRNAARTIDRLETIRAIIDRGGMDEDAANALRDALHIERLHLQSNMAQLIRYADEYSDRLREYNPEQ